MVIPRHSYALDDEPIEGSLTIRFDDPAAASAFHEAFREFVDFGRALDIPDGALFVDVELPGGLGGAVAGGGGRIGPALVQDPPEAWRIAVHDAADRTVLEVPLVTTSLTRGPGGGAELRAAHESGLLEINLVLDPPIDGVGELTFGLSLPNPTGHPVRVAALPIRFASLLQAGHRLLLLGEYGPEPLASHEFDVDASLVPGAVAQHVDDLATLQEFADFPIVVPDQIDPTFASELHHYARMLRGEAITGSWDEITLVLQQGVAREELASQFAEEGSFVAEEERFVDIHGRQIPLGLFTTTLANARLADEQPEESDKLRLVPGTSHAMTSRRGAVAQGN